MRFRKTVKICKGVKVNFSKSGISTTIGRKGASVNIGRRGTYLNTGIPGTGLYDRIKIGGSTSSYQEASDTSFDVAVNLDSNGNVVFRDRDNRTITDNSTIRKIKASPQFKIAREKLMSQRFDEITSETDKFINIYRFSPFVLNHSHFKNTLAGLKPQTYKREIFEKREPDKNDIREMLAEKASQEIHTWKIWKIGAMREQYVKDNLEHEYKSAYEIWKNEKKQFNDKQSELENEKNATYYTQYEEKKHKLDLLILGDKKTINTEIDRWLYTVELPIDFSLQYELLDNVVYIDLDLPEIEDIPTEKASALANGTVKRKNKTQKELRSDYIKCVFGTAVFFSANIFNVSPAIKNIVISGYTQRRNSKTGSLEDDYIYSINFSRKKFEETEFSKIDPYVFCMESQNRCIITSAMQCKTIIPYSNEDNELNIAKNDVSLEKIIQDDKFDFQNGDVHQNTVLTEIELPVIPRKIPLPIQSMLDTYKAIDNNYISYYKNGKLYDVFPRGPSTTLEENGQTAYDARYIVSDGIKYDLCSPESIKQIAIPDFSANTDDSYITHNLAYILRMRVNVEYHPETAVALAYKTANLMLASHYTDKKSYYRLVGHLWEINEIEYGDFLLQQLKIRLEFLTNDNYHSDICFDRALSMAKYYGNDLMLVSHLGTVCPECSIYQDRIYSITGKDTRFPVLPKFILDNKGIHCRNTVFAVGNSTNPTLDLYEDDEDGNSHAKTVDAIEYSNRPFVDMQSKSEKERYKRRKAEREKTRKAEEKYYNRDYWIAKYYNVLEYQDIVAVMGDKAPKSYNGYMRMKNTNSKNFQKILKIAEENNITIYNQ